MVEPVAKDGSLRRRSASKSHPGWPVRVRLAPHEKGLQVQPFRFLSGLALARGQAWSKTALRADNWRTTATREPNVPGRIPAGRTWELPCVVASAAFRGRAALSLEPARSHRNT